MMSKRLAICAAMAALSCQGVRAVEMEACHMSAITKRFLVRIFMGLVCGLLVVSCSLAAHECILLEGGTASAQIQVIGPQDRAIAAAAEDFRADIAAIAGWTTEPSLSTRVVIGKIADFTAAVPRVPRLEEVREQLTGKWESYRVYSADGNLRRDGGNPGHPGGDAKPSLAAGRRQSKPEKTDETTTTTNGS